MAPAPRPVRGPRQRSSRHDRRLERRRARARIREHPVRGGLVRGPHGAPAQARRRRPTAGLCPLAGGVLHVLDLLWQRGSGRIDRLRFLSGLSRADPAVRVRLARPAAHRAARQEPEHHLGRRLPGRALRQEPGRGGHRHGHRGGRHAALYRPAAEGGGAVGQRSAGAGRARPPALSGRHGVDHRHSDGHLRHPVRHPPHRRHRAPGRPDRGGGRRVRWSSWRRS